MRQTIAKDSPNRQYVSFDAAFDFFNHRLFSGMLPRTVITMQRKANTEGYFSPKRFESREDAKLEKDEIALNPGTFAGRRDADILATLVHNMTHLWQHHFGKPGRARYHNHQWAAKMEEIGLMPSDAGEPGGKRVGQEMNHFVTEGGPFDLACAELLGNGVTLEWQSRGWRAKKKVRSSKVKFSCPCCRQNVWGKPNIRVVCGHCDEGMVSENEEGG